MVSFIFSYKSFRIAYSLITESTLKFCSCFSYVTVYRFRYWMNGQTARYCDADTVNYNECRIHKDIKQRNFV